MKKSMCVGLAVLVILVLATGFSFYHYAPLQTPYWRGGDPEFVELPVKFEYVNFDVNGIGEIDDFRELLLKEDDFIRPLNAKINRSPNYKVVAEIRQGNSGAYVLEHEDKANVFSCSFVSFVTSDAGEVSVDTSVKPIVMYSASLVNICNLAAKFVVPPRVSFYEYMYGRVLSCFGKCEYVSGVQKRMRLDDGEIDKFKRLIAGAVERYVGDSVSEFTCDMGKVRLKRWLYLSDEVFLTGACSHELYGEIEVSLAIHKRGLVSDMPDEKLSLFFYVE